MTVSVLDLGPERVVLLACAGDPAGGGDDIDRGLLRAVLKGLKARFGEFPDQPAISEMIRQTCEGLKRDLGVMARARAGDPLPPRRPDRRASAGGRVDRERFEVPIGDTITRVEGACRVALEQAWISRPAISPRSTRPGRRQPAGGARSRSSASLGLITGRKLDADGAVALGAALQARHALRRVDAIPVIDVRPSTLAPASPGAPSWLPPGRPQLRARRPR